LLEEIEVEYVEKCLGGFTILGVKSYVFLGNKGMEVPEIISYDSVRDLASLVDLRANLNELNFKLQGENNLVYLLYSHVETFQAQLRLCETQLRSRNTFHFAALFNDVTLDYCSFAVNYVN
jgi:hypothetical protein